MNAGPPTIAAGTPVLVTGSSGFLGFPVAERLAAHGCRVIGIDPVAPREEGIVFSTLVTSLDDMQTIVDVLHAHHVEIVIHAGAVSGPMLSRDDPFHVARTNVVGTINLVEAARRAAVRRFVYCSSAAALGDTPPGIVPETSPLRPKDFYGATKGACELMLRGYREQYAVDAVSLRIANAYGPRRRTRCAIRTMLEDALAGRPTRMTWGRGYHRPYLYVDDAVDGILCAAAAPSVPQHAYNLAGAEFPSMDEIATLVRELVPNADIELGEGNDALAYDRGPLDLTAAERDLGFRPSTTMRDGIAAYAAWMQSQVAA